MHHPFGGMNGNNSVDISRLRNTTTELKNPTIESAIIPPPLVSWNEIIEILWGELNENNAKEIYLRIKQYIDQSKSSIVFIIKALLKLSLCSEKLVDQIASIITNIIIDYEPSFTINRFMNVRINNKINRKLGDLGIDLLSGHGNRDRNDNDRERNSPGSIWKIIESDDLDAFKELYETEKEKKGRRISFQIEIEDNGYTFDIPAYTVYCGSIKIYKYLKLMGARIIQNCIEKFAICGGNLEIIQDLHLEGVNFSRAFQLAMRLHRNDIAYWIFETQPGEMIFYPRDALNHFNFKMYFFALNNEVYVRNAKLHLLDMCIDWGELEKVKYAWDVLTESERRDFLNRGDDTLQSPIRNNDLEIVKFLVEIGVPYKNIRMRCEENDCTKYLIDLYNSTLSK